MLLIKSKFIVFCLFITSTICSLSSLSPAQIYFTQDSEYFINTTGIAFTFTRCVITGDIDLDGDEDIVVCDRYNEDIVLFLNDGEGHLSNIDSLFATEQTRIIVLKDLNNDGYLDLATAGKDGSNIFLNLGHDGSNWLGFDSPVYYFAGDNPHWVSVTDINTDGFQDLLIADFGLSDGSGGWGDGGWYVYLNQGDGTFDDGIYFNLGQNARCISILGQDLNGDTFPDIAVIGHYDLVHIYSNLGNDPKTGNWLGVSHTTTIKTVHGASSIRTLDIENDGDSDLIIAHRTVNQTSILVNDGAGYFSYLPIETIKSELAEPADINNDELIDFALVNNTTGAFKFMLNEGDGTFVQSSFSSPVDFQAGPKFLACSHINNDEHLDVVVVNSYPDQDIGSIKVFFWESACSNGDLNNDCAVDILDILILLTEWGACVGCDSDLNEDGVVDVQDLLVLIESWT